MSFAADDTREGTRIPISPKPVIRTFGSPGKGRRLTYSGL